MICVGSGPILTGVLEEDQKAKLCRMRNQTREENSIAPDDKGKAIVTGVSLLPMKSVSHWSIKNGTELLTDRVHRVRGKLKYAIEDESAALEKHISPVPAVGLDHVVGLGLDPKIECNQCNAADPSK